MNDLSEEQKLLKDKIGAMWSSINFAYMQELIPNGLYVKLVDTINKNLPKLLSSKGIKYEKRL